MFIVNVEAAIYRAGKWLVIKRGKEESHAAGTLALVGGKALNEGAASDILESTIKREVKEEVGVDISGPLHYVHNTSFLAGEDPVVDVVFLCGNVQGEPWVKSPEEVGGVYWMTTEEVLNHPDAPVWTKESIKRAEKVRGTLT
ncbi:NUDIX domain-containing protein [Bacillus sp. H-16]|uniref:NUDIX hydrolase n=1 Tax=Alteribacter salitolerans TaxID=2912333 RepID=UPI0019642831|nr:NUDIX domain-containing protein [Alteribacter salitolerans]MBM7096014.1 NUDIX domain-containing protein [Alteribacter salitolerans]